MTTLIGPICMSCLHFKAVVDNVASCDAFAEIPQAIVANLADHRQPIDGDGGIQFEQDPDQPKLMTAIYDGLFRRRPAGAEARAAKWEEEEHPREKTGKFAEKPDDPSVSTKSEQEKEAEKKKGVFFVDENVLAEARIKAAEKFDAAHVPTDEEVEAAREYYERVGAAKAHSNTRGSPAQRRSSRKRLSEEFGDGTGCPCVYCGAWLPNPDKESRVQRDRIYPGAKGGTYQYQNLVPADGVCNKRRKDRDFQDFVDGWGATAKPAKKAASPGLMANRAAVPKEGTVCRGTEATWYDSDFEPRNVEGPIVTAHVPVMDFTQVMIDGAVIDPDTLEVVE